MTKRTLAMVLLNVLAIAGIGRAQQPVGTVNGIPQPDPTLNPYSSTSLRYNLKGGLYAWDGLNVWKQNGSGGAFTLMGSVASGTNYSDAGPICFSQDGQTVLLSNGAGGTGGGEYNGEFFTMPASGGTLTPVSGGGIPYTYDALALPTGTAIPGSSTQYLVYAATNSLGTTSTLSIFDASAGTSQVVIANSPGATTSIAINPAVNRVYLGVSYYGTNAGNIYSFSLSQIVSAYSSRTPLDFLTAGTLFNRGGTGSQSGSGTYFDNNGYLFSGGDGITVFNSSGAIVYDQPASAADGYFDVLTFDPATNEVLKTTPYSAAPSTGTLYNAGDFEPAFWANANGGSWGAGTNWSGRPATTVAALVFAGSTSGTAVVTLDGNQSAAGLQFGDSSAASSYAITAGTGGTLTLGSTANGASIAVESGTQSISAPMVLAGNLAVSGSAGVLLNLSGDIGQQAGVSAALALSGGELVLSGSNSFSGGVAVLGGTLEMLHPYDLPDGSPLIVGNSTAFSGVVASAADLPRGTAAVPEPGCLSIAVALGIGTFALRRRFHLVAPRRFA